MANHEDGCGQTALVAAADAGKSEVVDLLLEAYGKIAGLRTEADIQSAFEAAADGGHTDIARDLVSRWNASPSRDQSSDEGISCPFCYRFYHPGTCVTCEHYVCTESEGRYENFRDFGGVSGQVEADLAELLGELDKLRFEELVSRASPQQEELLRIARRGAAEFVSTGDESIHVDVDGSLIGWSFTCYFTDSPERLRDRYLEVRPLLNWARANLPEVPEPPDNQDVLTWCDFCGEPITAERAYCSHFIVGWESERGYVRDTGVRFHASSSSRVVKAVTDYCRAVGRFYKAMRLFLGLKARSGGCPTFKQIASRLEPALDKDWRHVKGLVETIAEDLSESGRFRVASLGMHVGIVLWNSYRDVIEVEGGQRESTDERQAAQNRCFAIVMAEVTLAEIGPDYSDYDDQVMSSVTSIGERTESLRRCTEALEVGNAR